MQRDRFLGGAEQEEGVLVPVFASSSCDHCVCVDAERRIILDSEEEGPLQLCREDLISCAEPTVVKANMAEAYCFRCLN